MICISPICNFLLSCGCNLLPQIGYKRKDAFLISEKGVFAHIHFSYYIRIRTHCQAFFKKIFIPAIPALFPVLLIPFAAQVRWSAILIL